MLEQEGKQRLVLKREEKQTATKKQNDLRRKENMTKMK